MSSIGRNIRIEHGLNYRTLNELAKATGLSRTRIESSSIMWELKVFDDRVVVDVDSIPAALQELDARNLPEFARPGKNFKLYRKTITENSDANALGPTS